MTSTNSSIKTWKSKFLAPFRFVGLIGLIFGYILIGCLVAPLIPGKWRLRKILTYWSHLYSKAGLTVLGVEVIKEGQPRERGTHLYVSNHLSYVDIMVIAAQQPVCFVTSIEMKNTPVLGHLATVGGCLFVERRNKDNLRNEVSEITEALRNDVSVIVFPEATSTNGEQVLRFRRPLFNAAVDSGRSVKPLCINYQRIGDEEFSLASRDKICWYDDMSFAPHLWQLVNIGHVKVHLSYMKDVTINETIDAPALAEETHRMVSRNYIPCTVPKFEPANALH